MNNKEVISKLIKDSYMGLNSIKILIPLVEDKKFKNILIKEYKNYILVKDKLSKYINTPIEENTLTNIMTSIILKIKTIKDKSLSNISKILLEGTNMGIIEGIKILNNKKNIDNKIISILEDYIKMQESFYNEIKKYL